MSEPRLPDLARSFERYLRAENKSDRTVETYLEAVRLLQAYLVPRGVELAEADRAQIEAFLADLLARWKPATAANRYRSLKVFYAWLEDEGEITAHPMAKMKPPAIPEQPIPVLPDDALRRLFAACVERRSVRQQALSPSSQSRTEDHRRARLSGFPLGTSGRLARMGRAGPRWSALGPRSGGTAYGTAPTAHARCARPHRRTAHTAHPP